MIKSHTVTEALCEDVGKRVTLHGWISWKSALGGVIFVRIRDGSGYIQVAGKKDLTDEATLTTFKECPLESAVIVGGVIQLDQRAPGGKEISLREFETVASSETWPITKSAIQSSSSFLYDKRHLSLRGRKTRALMRIRGEVCSATFEFFTSKGFTPISSPTLVQAAVEGGSTLFKMDYFGQPAYLSQSAQFYEEAAICSLEKVFIFQPAFRAEKSRTLKHLTEFWMIEAEQAFTTQEDNMKLQEELVTYITSKVSEKRDAELKDVGRKFTPLESPFHRITYDEARDMAGQKNVHFEWGEDIPTEAERLISNSFEKPVFVTNYPLSARSFYHMAHPDNDKITFSADLFAPEGYGEIATGGQRIHDYETLLDRIKVHELPIEAFRWYLDLRKYGLPPHTGFGLGVERITRWISGARHIRETSLFPRTTTRLSP